MFLSLLHLGRGARAEGGGRVLLVVQVLREEDEWQRCTLSSELAKK